MMDPFIRTEIVRLNQELARLVTQGRIAEAVRTALRICDVVRQYLGEDHPLFAAALVATGDVYASARDLPAAEARYEEALGIGTRALGEPPASLAAVLEKLARLKVALGKQDEASTLYRRAVEIRRSGRGSREARSAGTTPVRTRGFFSSRGTAAPAVPASEPEDADSRSRHEAAVRPPEAVAATGREDAELRTVVPPLPALSDRGFFARVGDFCRTLAAGLKRRDAVESTVFAPPDVASGRLFFVQVFAHRPEQRQEAEQEAARADSQTKLRGRRSLRTEVARGTELLFHLNLPGLEIDEPHESLIWQGHPEAVQFAVRVPEGHPPGTVVGTLTTSVGRVPVGHVKFKLTVAWGTPPTAPTTTEHLGDEAHRYRQAFVCYASQDRPEVIKRVTMLRVGGIRVFQDVLSIEPGQRWEKKLYEYIDRCDLFLLFWSSAAKASEWVQKEVRYAWRRKQGDEMNPPEICPVILEAPPPFPPPAELAHLHFNDWMMYLAQEPASAPVESPAAPR